MFQVKVRVCNPSAPERGFEADFWVDTGALYSIVPEDRLESIGVAHFGVRNLILADGRVDQRRIGSALMKIENLDEQISCPIVFGPTNSLYLLGATALETFGLEADPTTQKLKPIYAVIGGFIGSRP